MTDIYETRCEPPETTGYLSTNMECFVEKCILTQRANLKCDQIRKTRLIRMICISRKH